MKLSILQENLAKGLATVSRSVASRAQLPVLSNILLATDQGRLKLSATNLETGINHWLGAKVEKEGAISVPARVFAEFVASLPAEKINLATRENNLLVNCGHYQAEFNGLVATEFPKIPSVKGKPDISFSS
ncbi:DNA polymerase III subunit beta, partial [Microgenomates bacterium DG_75]